MPERHIGKCPQCGCEDLYEFTFERSNNSTIQSISVPCRECAHELEWTFLPKANARLKDLDRVG